MARDLIEGKSRAVLIGIYDLSEFNEAQLDESLETIADTGHETVSGLQKFGNSFLDLGIPEEGCDELARSVRFVSSGEAAGDKDHLALADLVSESLYRLSYLC